MLLDYEPNANSPCFVGVSLAQVIARKIKIMEQVNL